MYTQYQIQYSFYFIIQGINGFLKLRPQILVIITWLIKVITIILLTTN